MSFWRAELLNVLSRVKALEALGLLTITPAGLALIDDADASAQLTTLGVSTFIKTLLDDADAATARTTLGVTAQTSSSAATTSGTSIDVTGIPSTTTRITITFNAVSTNGITRPIVQIGDSGGIETSGYTGANVDVNAAPAVTSLTSGIFVGGTSAANSMNGVCELWLVSGAIWAFRSQVTTTTNTILCTGMKTLSAAPLDRFRLTSAGGADTFDAGSIGYHFQ